MKTLFLLIGLSELVVLVVLVMLVVRYLRHESQLKKHLRGRIDTLNRLRIRRRQREIREAASASGGAELSVGELSVGAGHGMVCAGKRSPEVGDAVHGSAGVVGGGVHGSAGVVGGSVHGSAGVAGGGVGRLASCAMIDFVLYERLRRLGILDSGVRGHNVGASDYSRHVIQPWSIWLDYGLNPWDADIVKRVLRTKDGESRRLDYEKIIHICQERIRQLGG